MNPVQVADDLEARLRSLRWELFTEPLDGPPAGPYVVFYAGPGDPTFRRPSGESARLAMSGHAVCVSNTRVGAIRVAQDVVELLDGKDVAGHVIECTANTVNTDEDAETGYRFSVTVDIAVEQSRGH